MTILDLPPVAGNAHQLEIALTNIIRNAVEALFGKIDDTYFAAGSEAYAAALLVYQYAKLHNLASGALEDSLDDLGRRFARKSKKPAAPSA